MDFNLTVTYAWAPPLLFNNSQVVCHKFTGEIKHKVCANLNVLSILLYSHIRKENDQHISSCEHWQVDFWEWEFFPTTGVQQINVSELWVTF